MNLNRMNVMVNENSPIFLLLCVQHDILCRPTPIILLFFDRLLLLNSVYTTETICLII